MRRSRAISNADFEASVALVLRDYNTLLARIASGEATPEEIKEFATRHAAARAALAHLDHLNKLAGPDDEAAVAARDATLASARAAIGEAGEAADDADE